jgi:cytosine/uracil/thiamine/allantoin permease
MRVFIGCLLGFIAGAIVSYFALMVGYSVYVDLFKVHDQDGGGAMAMGLIIGPLVALICGIVAAIVCGVRLAQQR